MRDLSDNTSLIVVVWLDESSQLTQIKKILKEYTAKVSFIQSQAELIEQQARLDILITSESQVQIKDLKKIFQQKKYDNLKGLIYFGKETTKLDVKNLAVEFCDKQCSESLFRHKLVILKSLVYRDKELHEKEAELLHYHALMLEEQTIAKNIFSEFMHSESIHYPELQYFLSPMSTYNGDILLADKQGDLLYVMLGDFTGHGLPSAIGSIPTSETFYAMTKKQMSLEKIAEEINAKLKKLLPSHMFCAASLLLYDAKAKILSVWQGGLPTGYLISQNSQKIIELSSRHLPLGILAKKDFETDIDTFTIKQSTKVVLFTDGFIEMKNSEGKVISGQQIVDKLVQDTKESPTKVLQTLLKEHMGSESVGDDIAIVSMDLL